VDNRTGISHPRDAASALMLPHAYELGALGYGMTVLRAE
jgi:hypothetical protein